MALFNLIWFIMFGALSALVWLLVGILFSITIIGIPIGKACFQFAKLSAFPFGKEVIKETELKGSGNVSMIRKVGGVILNIIWFPIGLFLAALNVVFAIVSVCTIIGIPMGVVYVKMARFALMPIGAKCVSKKQAYASAAANEWEKRQNK